ncbi:hypothetical protein MCAG_00537 [Micromonospora sp. ATCC 39149]|uniref:maltokinase N-terminal cap-like domain-containing protein n=1 Tax=Micromonospora sp. (strain ATCC 39149 / NRRL 15099 / SCC 1413) TaxID=219305 RepID=UPI0001A5119B|nr:hypothetical protein MCAG_00537 [Micromonospora sp. ATCC 39149]
MVLLHRAEIRPTKLELLSAWLPGRPWFQGEVDAGVERVAAYRFDDPAGQVSGTWDGQPAPLPLASARRADAAPPGGRGPHRTPCRGSLRVGRSAYRT